MLAQCNTLLVGILFILLSLFPAGTGTGKLTHVPAKTSVQPDNSLPGGTVVADGTSLVCKAKPPYNDFLKSFADISSATSVKSLGELGIFITVEGKDSVIHKLGLEIWSGEKRVFATGVECGGCKTTYKAGDKQSPRGYLFVLDPAAVQAGEKFFLPKNHVVILISGHNGGTAHISLVNAAQLRASHDRSPQVLSPRDRSPLPSAV